MVSFTIVKQDLVRLVAFVMRHDLGQSSSWVFLRFNIFRRSQQYGSAAVWVGYGLGRLARFAGKGMWALGKY